MNLFKPNLMLSFILSLELDCFASVACWKLKRFFVLNYWNWEMLDVDTPHQMDLFLILEKEQLPAC